jgi:hypothetical protein
MTMQVGHRARRLSWRASPTSLARVRLEAGCGRPADAENMPADNGVHEVIAVRRPARSAVPEPRAHRKERTGSQSDDEFVGD